VATKLEQFTADKMGKGQLFRGNRRNLSGEGVVRKKKELAQIRLVVFEKNAKNTHFNSE